MTLASLFRRKDSNHTSNSVGKDVARAKTAGNYMPPDSCTDRGMSIPK